MALVLENGIWKLQPGGASGPTTTTYSPNGDGNATLGTADADGFRTITNTGLDGLYVWDPNSALTSINDDGSRFRFTNGIIASAAYPFESWQFQGNDKGIVLVLGQPNASSCAVEATISAITSNTNARAALGVFHPYEPVVSRVASGGIVTYGSTTATNQVWAKQYDDGPNKVSAGGSGQTLPVDMRYELNRTAGPPVITLESDFILDSVSLATYTGVPFAINSWLGLGIAGVVASTIDITSFSVTT